jgi:hypothetical protein
MLPSGLPMNTLPFMQICQESETMTHRYHYLELNPEKPANPSPLAIFAGAGVAMLTLWAITVFLFSL